MRTANPVNPEQKLARSLAGRAFGPNGKAATAVAPTVVHSPALRAGDVELGAADTDGTPIGIDLAKLIEGRLLIQGVSGAGKSWTLRRLLEQTAGQVQQIVVDPEGEFRGLAERYGHLVLEAHRLDAASLALAARRAREHRLSVLLDASQLGQEHQMIAVAAFFRPLIEAPRAHWHTCLVAVDEAHRVAPFGGQAAAATSVRKAAIGAVVDLMGLGRKRGLTGVLASSRLARLSKSVASEVLNFMVGVNTLDLDIRRAAETLGWDTRKAFDRLPMLQPGDFVAVGPAFSRSPTVLRVGPVETRHVGAAPVLTRPAEVGVAAAAELLELDALIEASAADAAMLEERAEPDGLRGVCAFIREPAFADAGRIWGELVELVPDGALISDLAKHLQLTLGRTGAALALLDLYGAVEFTGAEAARAVRIAKGMRP